MTDNRTAAAPNPISPAVTRRLVRGHLAVSITAGADQATEVGIERDGREVLPPIRLGLIVDDAPLGGDSELVGWEVEPVVETFTMRTGKAAGFHVAHHEQAVATLRDRSTGRVWAVLLRVGDDGVAFRYRLPGDTPAPRVGDELTRLALPADCRVWPLEYQTYYETPRFGADSPEIAAGHYGFPFLLRRADGDCILLTEAAIDGRFSGAHAIIGDPCDDGGRPLVVGAAESGLETPGGAELPWRVLIVGELETIVQSNLVDELAPCASAALERAPWVRPGRAAWSWWSDPDSPADPVAQCRFVDFAAGHHWEYVLIDAGWDASWAPEVIAYARRRGVGVFLWSHWEDLPRGQASAEVLARWKSWGASGVKVDFMESESRERYRWYDWIIAETARLELMVNVHGSVIPRGWARTYPHVMTYEAIRGAEYYIMDMPSPTAAHNVIQPFTRNVVGSMDYTPVTFGPRAADRETSDGHELALSVAFESGITHFADDVGEYDARRLVTAFLDRLPSSWQETRLLGGDPDREAVIARRSGSTWFIGCIASGAARTVTVPIGRLFDDSCDVWIVSDDPTSSAGRGFVERATRASAGESIDVHVAHNGGFVAIATA